MAANFVSNTVADAQTAITSLGGAVAGAAAERIGNSLIDLAGLHSQKSLGDTGMRFIVRALASSAVYSVAVTAMPETSENLMFSLLYFGANSSLINDGVLIGNAVAGGLGAITRTNPPVHLPPRVPDRYQRGTACRQCL